MMAQRLRPRASAVSRRLFSSRMMRGNRTSFVVPLNHNASFYSGNLNRTLSTTSSSSSQWWWIRKPEKGTGFDNFLPPHDKQAHNDESSQQQNNKKGNDNRQNNNNNGNNLGLWLLLLAAGAYMATSSSSNHSSSDESAPHRSGGMNALTTTSASGNQGEIAWHQFYQLLQHHQVVKLVVTADETKMARVYVQPNVVRGTNYASSSHKDHHPWSADNSNNSNAKNYNSRRSQSENTKNDSNAAGVEFFQEAHMMRAPQGDNNNNNNDDDSASEFMNPNGQSDINSTTTTMDNSSSSSTAGNRPLRYYTMRIGTVDAFERKLEDAQRGLGREPSQDVPVQYTSSQTLSQALLRTLPGFFIAAVVYATIRMAARGAGGGFPGARSGGGGMGGIFQIGKSTAKKIKKEDIHVNFAHVAGCDEAKKEIMEFVDFLKDPEPFTKLGAKIPKGALLCGPPGTGKTLLAKAVAGESGVPFYSISGSDFIEMFVGVGPSRVRDLFAEARQNAPCIVFIDEIDAVGRQRGRGGMGGNDERENTLNQLLVEMDGFSPSTGVVVLAGTNRPDILDQALTRPGRFDRQITVDKPDLKGRKAIFEVHLKGIQLQDSADSLAGRLAGLTPGFAGADIANICNEAAIVAARRKAETVSMEDFEKATDRIIGGLESNKLMSTEERSIVAHHEAGHAVAGWFLEHADPLLKVTIIPRTSGALGFAQYLPKEVFLRTQQQIMDIVCMALAGRAAEDIFFGRVTTGASDDLKRVTELVYSTIQLYGMNARLGQLSFPKDPNAMFEERPYSEKTAKAMDEEARAIVDEAYQRSLTLLREKKEDVAKIAKMLLEKETITHDDIFQVIGERPFEGDPSYREFVTRRKQELKKKLEEVEKKSDDTNDEESADPTVNPGLA